MGVYSRRNSSFICEISIDTGKARRFTNSVEGFEGIPSFSSDGKRVAYSYSPGHNRPSRVVIAKADGSGPSSWPPSDANDFRPLFAPDNKTVIFARSGYYGNYSPIARPAHRQWDFYASNVEGTETRQLTNEDFYMVSRASISPNGKTMLFVSSEQSGDVLVVYSLEQPSKPKTVIRPPVQVRSGESILGDAMYMPDGKSILFDAATSGPDGRYDYDIYRMDLGTHRAQKLTTANGYAYGLQLSPDGKTAVFMKDISHWYGKTETEILLLDIGTGTIRPLVVTGV
jgi:Tol biopolymer transport system component